MAKVPLKFISEANFANDNVPWIQKLLRPLNEFISAYAGALQNGLTFAQNCTCQYNDITIAVPASGSTYTPYPFGFTWNYPQVKPRGCLIIYIDNDGTDGVIGYPQPRWEYENNRIVIKGLRGNLTASTKYRMTFMTFA